LIRKGHGSVRTQKECELGLAQSNKRQQCPVVHLSLGDQFQWSSKIFEHFLAILINFNIHKAVCISVWQGAVLSFPLLTRAIHKVLDKKDK
ncbi:hypothetical protein PanWU01x14_268560, partial [Parasponia andersonii]